MTSPDLDSPDPLEPLTRRDWVIAIIVAALAIAALVFGSAAFAQTGRAELRVGYEKSASLFVLQKAQGTREKLIPKPLRIADEAPGALKAIPAKRVPSFRGRHVQAREIAV